MSFNEELPKWENEGTKPPTSKINEGWQPAEKPPAGWFNWLLNRTYKALQELQQKAMHKDDVTASGIPTDDGSNVQEKLNEHESQIQTAQQTADNAADVAADAQSTANSHASRHAAGGPDEITPESIGAETPAGAQAKADAALNSAKQYTDQEVGEVAQELAAYKAETVIKQNLTINVPTDYPTVQAALDALKYAWIPRDVTVAIQVAAGTYIHTSPIVVDHPCGSQIRIIGATPITTTITGAGTVSGSAGNWSVPITVTDVTGIQVGQYAIIRNTSGTGDHFAHIGIWEITAVDIATKTVTVKNTHRASTFPMATLSGGDFIVLTTVLKFSGCHGIVSYDKSLGLLDNVALVGNNTVGYDGIYLTRYDHSTLRGGSIRCGSNVGISSFDTGAQVCAGSLVAHDVAASGNGACGFYAQYSGSIYARSSTASGNGACGFYAQYSGSIYAHSSTASGNASHGYFAQASGSIYAPSSTASGNATDYKAEKMGYILCAGYAGTPTFSPALNTEGNYNAIITT